MVLISVCTILVLLTLLTAAVRRVPCSADSLGFDNRMRYVTDGRLLLIFALILIATSSLRQGFIDTYAYRIMYTSMAGDTSFVETNTWGIEAGWLYFLYFLNFISSNPQLMLFISAAVITAAYVLTAKKYSADVCFSLLIYFCITYLNTNNGLRQYVAAAITILAFPLLLKPNIKKVLLYMLCVLAAYQFHQSAWVCVLIMAVVLGKPLNFRVIVALGFCAAFLIFPGTVNDYIAEIFDESKYLYYLDYTAGMGALRALITGVLPCVLAVSYIMKKRRTLEIIEYKESVLLNVLFINTIFVLMGLVMQYWARFTFYTEFAPIVLMPKLICEFTGKKHYQTVSAVAVISYLFFFCYNVYVNIGYGSMDSFTADWTWLRQITEVFKLW